MKEREVPTQSLKEENRSNFWNFVLLSECEGMVEVQ
jgi:hypothetical protein